MRTLLSLSTLLVATLVAGSALANKNGLTGYSGKPNLADPAGASCNKCHNNGGTEPTVTITGPASLAAGQVGDYSLVITTNEKLAAAAIAATDTIVLTPKTGLQFSFDELIPNGGLAVKGGMATFTFQVKAPLLGNTLRLWAAGLAANDDGNTGGDRAKQVIKDVAVTGGTVIPDAGSDAGDGGTPTTDAGEEPDGGATSSSSSASSSGTSGASSGSSGDGTSSGDPTSSSSSSSGGKDDMSAGGCSTSARGAGDVGLGSLGLAALVMAPLLAARRRRRRT